MSKVSIVNYSSGSNVSLLEEVCFIARVSNPKNQNNHENDGKLIKYLIDNKHWSPFEMVNICLKIQTTRDISRQLLRHRSFSFQEFSQRYSKDMDAPILRESRLQDKKNRQNSLPNENSDLQNQWLEKQKEVIQKSQDTYQWALEKGIAKEQARVVLPEGNTSTTLFVNGNLRSWIHYIQVRSEKSTQKEHRILALECCSVIKTIFPPIEQFLNLSADEISELATMSFPHSKGHYLSSL